MFKLVRKYTDEFPTAQQIFLDKRRSRFTIQEGNIKTEFDAKKN